MMRKIKESDVRKYFYEQAEKNLCKAEKFTSPSSRDVPDELVTTRWGQMYLVELKRPGGELRPGQVRDHAVRAEYGVRVYVVDSYGGADAFFSTIARL
jgi:hypothetical protein